MGKKPQTEFKDVLINIHEWFVDNWENVLESAEFTKEQGETMESILQIKRPKR